jgi:hypothetical protein
MRRFATIVPVLALALAAALPLAQAHCMFMGAPVPDRTRVAPMAADHSCCKLPASDAPARDEDGCPCLQIPPATLSVVVTLVAPSPGGLVAMLPAAAPTVMPHGASMRVTDLPGTPFTSSHPIAPHPLRGPPSFLPLG